MSSVKRRAKAHREVAENLRKQALLSAKELPPVSEGLEYRVTADSDGDHLMAATPQAYTAILIAEALADRLQTQTHVSLGTYRVSSVEPRRRRRRLI